ncbi:MAG: hypothetical protein ACP6IQ_02235 [Candidatus Njordarchaeia archaeon]
MAVSFTKVNGTSPYVKITAEDLTYKPVNESLKVSRDREVSPPVLGNGNSYSVLLDLRQSWNAWYTKLTEPKFDGVGQYLGQVTNNPDFIKDYHMILIMRNVETIIAPRYKALIRGSASMPQPKGSNHGRS